MPTTSNFGWTTPADTDLVKDGAAAIRTLGNGIDTSFLDLKGGTTGQVLSKASNTDLDFTWVAQDDSNAIQNAIVDAKGDLISATAADTPARLASSAVNGDVLTVDTSTATGLKWAAPSAGAYTLLSTTALSGSSVTVSSISQNYTDLICYVDKAIISVEANLTFRFNATGNYYTSRINNTTLDNNNNASTVRFATSSVQFSGVFIYLPQYTRAFPKSGTAHLFDTNNGQMGWVTYGDLNSAAVTTFVLSSSGGGTFTSGNLYIYGVK